MHRTIDPEVGTGRAWDYRAFPQISFPWSGEVVRDRRPATRAASKAWLPGMRNSSGMVHGACMPARGGRFRVLFGLNHSRPEIRLA